tara:strand:- start:158 stop:430 length:273 start_codon:yes stop_codon:yes gene_type:complete
MSGSEPNNPTAAEPVSHAADVFMFPAAERAEDVPNATDAVGNSPALIVKGPESGNLYSKKSSPDVSVPPARDVPLPSPAVAEFIVLQFIL